MGPWLRSIISGRQVSSSVPYLFYFAELVSFIRHLDPSSNKAICHPNSGSPLVALDHVECEESEIARDSSREDKSNAGPSQLGYFRHSSAYILQAGRRRCQEAVRACHL